MWWATAWNWPARPASSTATPSPSAASGLWRRPPRCSTPAAWWWSPTAKPVAAWWKLAPLRPVREFRRTHPDHVIVSYINTSIEVKAESDILCTSRNAVKIVNSIPPERPILFLPDSNLGNYVRKQTGRRNMQIWQGSCIVHATFPARRLAAAMAEHPGAKVAAHPECPEAVLAMADFVGSTSAMVDWCASIGAPEFIVMTESGIRYSLEKRCPGKLFYFVANENCNCSECPYMRRNTLEKLRDCLLHLEPRVELAPEIAARSLRPLERMLAVK